jgi:hypothetical protein
MKNIKSKLFEKFDDSVLADKAMILIDAGLAGPGSDSTGDHDCTNRPGWGADCGDSETSAVYDADPTSSGDDSCKVALTKML